MWEEHPVGLARPGYSEAERYGNCPIGKEDCAATVTGRNWGRHPVGLPRLVLQNGASCIPRNSKQISGLVDYEDQPTLNGYAAC